LGQNCPSGVHHGVHTAIRSTQIHTTGPKGSFTYYIMTSACESSHRNLQNPTIPTNPEQTSSIISMMTYTFLDPIIVMGSKVSHLPADQLPLLNDRDGAKYQTGWAFKVCCWFVGENICISHVINFQHLDVFSGAKRRSMFLRLMRVFCKIFVFVTLSFRFLFLMVAGLEYTVLALTICGYSLGSFFAPIGIYQILL